MPGPIGAGLEPRLGDHFGVPDEAHHPFRDALGRGRYRDPFPVGGLVGVSRGIVDRPIAGALLHNAKLVVLPADLQEAVRGLFGRVKG